MNLAISNLMFFNVYMTVAAKCVAASQAPYILFNNNPHMLGAAHFGDNTTMTHPLDGEEKCNELELALHDFRHHPVHLLGDCLQR